MSGNFVELRVLQRHTADLTTAIKTNPSLFGQHLVTHGFTVQTTVDSKVDVQGIPNYEKASRLLSLVDSVISTAGSKENARRYFDALLVILDGPMGQTKIVQTLKDTYYASMTPHSSQRGHLQVSDSHSRSQYTARNNAVNAGGVVHSQSSNASGGGPSKETHHDLNIKIDDNTLGQIPDGMYEWEGRIADELGLDHTDVKAIKKRNPFELKLQTRDALALWKQKKGDNATYKNLIGAFERAGYQLFADNVKRLATERKSDTGVGYTESSKQPSVQPEPPTRAEPQPKPGSAKPDDADSDECMDVENGDTESDVDAEDVDGGASAQKGRNKRKKSCPKQNETPEYGDDFAKSIKKCNEMTREQELALDDENFSNGDIVIIAAVNENEVQAIRHFMKPLKPDGNIPTLLKHPTVTSMILGKIGGCNAVLVRTEPGPKCKESIKEALKEYPNAKAVIAVGVAYGASRNYKFADVLVSEEILGCGSERISDDVTLDARQLTLIHKSPFQKNLLRALTFYKDHWDSVQCTKEGRQANVHVGTIVSMSLLVDNKNARDSLTRKVSKMIGGEMEGDGLLDLQKEYLKDSREIGVMIVKGISDYADGNKDKRWQLTAAIAAASYVEKMISENHRLFKPQDFAAEQ